MKESVSKLTSNVVAPRKLVHVLLALGALLARLLDGVLRRLLVLLALLVPAVVLHARLALVPGHVVDDAVPRRALGAPELGARVVVDLARFARRRQTPAEARDILERRARDEVVVSRKRLGRCASLDVVVLEELRAVGALEFVPRPALES